MVKKLAIVISGAVSLGSYEAGVMYEVLEAIARHNEDPKNVDNLIEIDLITGASAGGMTACILAQNLLFEDGTLRKPYENSLYQAWVQKVDIVPLLQVEKDDQKKSLLQVNVVEDIAEALLLDTENAEGKKHKHSAASSEIQIGVAMSNLNGFNYQIETSQNEEFGYTRFKDQFVCSVRRKEVENGKAVAILPEKQLVTKEGIDQWEDFRPIEWSDLREAGISSGAFPYVDPDDNTVLSSY